MLREIDEIFTESLHLTPVKKKRKRLYRILEQIRIHPSLDTLDGRELFSERIALLMAKHWSGSRLLWQEARDFFGWQYPVPSDYSPMAHSLRKLFQEEDEQEKSSMKSKVKFLFSSWKTKIWRKRFIWIFILFVLMGIVKSFQREHHDHDLKNLPDFHVYDECFKQCLGLTKQRGHDMKCFKQCMDNKFPAKSTPPYIINPAIKYKRMLY